MVWLIDRLYPEPHRGDSGLHSRMAVEDCAGNDR